MSLEKVHVAFHRSVAEVIRKANDGDIPGALEMLHEGSYAECSYAMKTELARLCRAHGDH